MGPLGWLGGALLMVGLGGLVDGFVFHRLPSPWWGAPMWLWASGIMGGGVVLLLLDSWATAQRLGRRFEYVRCLQCKGLMLLADWERRGRCASCGHEHYAYIPKDKVGEALEEWRRLQRGKQTAKKRTRELFRRRSPREFLETLGRERKQDFEESV